MNKPALCKRERTRQAIVHAAIHIIAVKGLDGTSIDELMKEAGMARGTFYNYFQTREEVLEAVIDELRQHLQANIESHIPQHPVPEIIVACMMLGIYQYCVDHPCLGRVLVKLGGDNEWISAYNLEDGHFPRSDAAILSLIKDDIPFIVSLTFIEGAMNQLIRRALQQQMDSQAAEQVTGMILRGLNADDRLIEQALIEGRAFAERIHSNADDTFRA